MPKTYAVEITRQDRDMLVELLRGQQTDLEMLLMAGTRFDRFYQDKIERIKALIDNLNSMEV